MFLGLRDRIKSEEVIDCESKLKARTWESGHNFHSPPMANIVEVLQCAKQFN